MNAAVVSRGDGFERRARVLPWGIEVEVWRLVETLTFPATAASLPINSLFPEQGPGLMPHLGAEDEKTLENLVEESSVESCLDLAGEPGEKDAPK